MDCSLLVGTPLFSGLDEAQVEALLPCLGARERSYKKGETLLGMGETTSSLGLVLEGSVNVMTSFFWGATAVFGHVASGEIFAETYAAIPQRELMVSVVAAEDARVLWLSMERLLTTCSRGCARHQGVIANLVRISASKNLGLSERMMHTAPKTIRGRLLSYLSAQAQAAGQARFTIPFDRQQLADYLGVDRSALSAELGRMQREGLLVTRKSEFTLLRG